MTSITVDPVAATSGALCAASTAPWPFGGLRARLHRCPHGAWVACTCGPDFCRDDSRVAAKRRSLAVAGYPERLLPLYDRAPRCIAATKPGQLTRARYLACFASAPPSPASDASSNYSVRSPRRRSPASYAGQFVTR